MLDSCALVVAGGPVGRGTTAVEVISLDPVHHPVPACLKNRAPLPAKKPQEVEVFSQGASSKYNTLQNGT